MLTPRRASPSQVHVADGAVCASWCRQSFRRTCPCCHVDKSGTASCCICLDPGGHNICHVDQRWLLTNHSDCKLESSRQNALIPQTNQPVEVFDKRPAHQDNHWAAETHFPTQLARLQAKWAG